MRQIASRFALTVTLLLFLLGAIALVRHTRFQGQDFEVFYRSANAVLSGESAYDRVRDGAMVFKYPPWILPAFFPFAFLPLEAAKWAWGAVQVVSLVWVLVWLDRRGVSARVLAVCTAAFWGIWAVHALDGQISLPLLAIALAAADQDRPIRSSFLGWALSAKVFGILAWVGSRARPRGVKPWALVVLTWLLASLPVLVVGAESSPWELLVKWRDAAQSGAGSLGFEKVFGRENQGFPALIMRAFDLRDSVPWIELLSPLILAFTFGWWWNRKSRGLGLATHFAGWLALVCVFHPLAWFHQFVFAFPAAVLALDRASAAGRKGATALAFIAILLIGVVTRRTLGEMGERLELAAIKSWGVLLSLWVLSRSADAAPDALEARAFDPS